MQVRRRGSNLLHDHDSVEKARASDDAAGHEVGSAHLALQMQVWHFIHLHLARASFGVRTQVDNAGVRLRFMVPPLMLCKYGSAYAADNMV